MEIMDELYCLSLPLANHPIKNAKDEIKEYYLIVLSFFVKEYAENNTWAKIALSEYSKCLFAPAYIIETWGYEDIKILIKKRALFAHRYNLICDILFLTSFGDASRLSIISNAVLNIFHQRHKNKIQHFMNLLVSGVSFRSEYKTAKYLTDCWRMNAEFINLPEKKIMVTAAMSAGKSTLINTLMCIDLFEIKNEACTDKIQFVCNKPFDDGIVFRAGNAAAIYSKPLADSRYRIIDTPGVNSAKYTTHRTITQTEIIKGDFEVLLYVFNATQLGVEDDDAHLRFVVEHLPAQAKILFVLNKLDEFGKDDSVNESIMLLKENLTSLGINSPIICPVSMKAGRLAKMVDNGMNLDKKSRRLYDAFFDELGGFNSSQLDLTSYYTMPAAESAAESAADKTCFPPLAKCGIFGFEQTLIRIGV